MKLISAALLTISIAPLLPAAGTLDFYTIDVEGGKSRMASRPAITARKLAPLTTPVITGAVLAAETASVTVTVCGLLAAPAAEICTWPV